MGARYRLTVALFVIATLAGEAALVMSDRHHSVRLWAAGIACYVAGLALMLVYRDAFIRLNRGRPPWWLWCLAGALPVVGVALIPDKSSWPIPVFSAVLGVLVAVAIINPRLRGQA
jgi:hypothetical protein